MKIPHFVKHAEHLINDNAPAILTAAGLVGAGATVVLTGKAAYKAAYIIEIQESKEGTAETPQKRFQERASATWKLYMPAVGVGMLSCVCLVAAHKINAKRLAAVGAAYAITQDHYEEYRDKIKETLGVQKEEKARAEIVQDRINQDPPSPAVLNGLMDGSQVIMRDESIGRYFIGNVNQVEAARNSINNQLRHEDRATVTDFYSLLGLPPTSMSDDLGWNVDKPLELRWATGMTEDGTRPVVTFDFAVLPMYNMTHFR